MNRPVRALLIEDVAKLREIPNKETYGKSCLGSNVSMANNNVEQPNAPEGEDEEEGEVVYNMPLRQRMMHQDMYAVVEACIADNECPFYGFTFNDWCFSFEFKALFTKNTYRINMCADYPAGTIQAIKSNRTGPDFNTELVNERIPIIFNNLSKKVYRDMKVGLPVVEEFSDEDDDPKMETTEESKETTDAEGATASQDHTDSEEDDEDEDPYDFDYFEELESQPEALELHPLMTQDMESVKQRFGDNAITFRDFPSIGDIDIELHIDVDHFDPVVAKAWRVNRNEPVIVRLHMVMAHYLDTKKPKVEVFQPSQKENFGFGSQIKNILGTMFDRNWDKITNKLVEEARSRKYLSILGVRPENEIYVKPESMEKLRGMGFDMVMIRNALQISLGDEPDAINLILQYPEQCTYVPSPASKLPDLDLRSPPRKPQAASPKKPSSSSSSTKDSESSTSQTQEAEATFVDVRKLPSFESGFLVMIYEYIQQRLDTLNEYCVVCDEPHVFQSATMLKPAVCGRDLCVFAFQTLGVMSDAAEDVATGPEVVDLLIAMGKAACKSHRKSLIFDPYPTVVDPKDSQKLAFNPKEKNFLRCEKALNCLSMSNLGSLHGAALRNAIDALDPLAYPLLQWLIVSNRSHIVKLPKDKQLPFMHTPHQFLLMSSPPAKEAKFRQYKKQYGSTFAFHGSDIANWHSILRVGLMNASGTKYQMHGAAHGHGIYLSPLAATSFSYSGVHDMVLPQSGGSRRSTSASTSSSATQLSQPGHLSRFLKDGQLTCIALCEVVTSPELKKSQNIWVMSDPDKVCTRFFFVYDSQTGYDPAVDTQISKYSAPILTAVKHKFC